MTGNNLWISIGVAVLFHGVLWWCMPNNGYTTDLNCWDWWRDTIYQYGFAHCYQYATIEYPPVFIYLLGLWRWLIFDFSQPLYEQRYLYKYIPWCFSLAGAVWLPFYLQHKRINPVKSLLLLGCVGLWYNFFAWGQIDVIHTLFITLAVCCAAGNKPTASALFFLLALNTKVQTVVFVPPFLMLWATIVKGNTGVWVKTLLAAAALQLLLLLPFLISKATLKVYLAYATSVDRYDYVSFFAFNLWYWFFANPYTESDTLLWNFLSLKQWGLLLLFANMAVLLTAFGVFLFNHKASLTESNRQYLAHVFLLFALVGIAFFYFPTQMHERYLHPAVAFLGMFAILERQYGLFAFISLAYLVNLEAVLHFTPLPYWHYLPALVSGMVLCSYVYGVYLFYHIALSPAPLSVNLLPQTERP
ncbi:hypothetical protein C7N43_14920 [Sphingobacteriales bacterium UPWRP_1]|nr:hypothetical protein C7N43_14920 [Sphingobacteriales bacterium UPWRP_1]